MNQDFFPRRNAEATLWATNFKTQIATLGLIVGQTAAQNTASQVNCTKIVDAINDVETKKAALASAISAKEAIVKTQLALLRADIKHFKTHAAYTASIGDALGVVGENVGVEMNTFKPNISAALFGNIVRIKFTKNGIEGVNIYHRKKGGLTWNFLARDTKSPYDDHIVLAIASVPEHWEYKAFGVIDDNEIDNLINQKMIEVKVK